MFTVNGEPQGVAFSLTKEELEGRALYPHVLTKNCRFEVNFGLKEEPWFQPMEGFEWAAKVPVESRVRGPRKVVQAQQHTNVEDDDDEDGKLVIVELVIDSDDEGARLGHENDAIANELLKGKSYYLISIRYFTFSNHVNIFRF